MWYAYDGLWPFSGRVDDERLAYELATMAQLQTGGKLRLPPKPDLSRTPWTVDDFLLRRGFVRSKATTTAQTRVPRISGPSMQEIASAFSQVGIIGRPG